MQRFPCPFCGLRDETEFHFAVEAGQARPEPAGAVSDQDWSTYLYENASPKGPAREVWLHLTCGEYFILTRDTVTREVIGTEPLPGVAE
ncbi:MAG: sarcosine oxidase subunit delta [Paracoccaceae bacterium]|nr:sarcosine oxidase subunit delta [Paracoccaceae bacterium]